MGRKTARELAFKLLFQLEIQGEDKEEQINVFLNNNDLDNNSKEYILDVVKGALDKLDLFDKNIEKYLKGWKINRISKVDLSILRLAMYEILSRSDIPENVSINEAVEIAKKYNSEEAGAFINGILGNFVRDSIKT